MAIQISASTDDLPRVIEIVKEAGQDMDITVTVNDQQQRPTEIPQTKEAAHAAEAIDAAETAVPAAVLARIDPRAVQKLRHASLHDLPLLLRFVAQQVTEQRAVVDPGPDLMKYVRIHLPSHRGAYCYATTRGYVDFRLGPEDQRDCRFATVRKGDNHGAPYSVRLRLDSEAALEEALSLATTAANRIRGLG